MALKISQLAAGILPVVEREVPLLKDHPEGSTIKIQLLSRRHRLDIYPDAKPGDEADMLAQSLRAINDKAVPLRQARSDLAVKAVELGKRSTIAKGQALDSEDVSAIDDARKELSDLEDQLAELDEQIEKLEIEYQEALEAQGNYELVRATRLIQATLTDDTGEFLTDEQVKEAVENKQNEKVTKQILDQIMIAHGVGVVDDAGEP